MDNTINPDVASNAVSVYGQDALDDFPVLKAFQQYIDAEQAKARKRLVVLCIFFGCLMFVVISVFVGMLFSVSSKNQALNDRLIEYAMSRDRTAAGGSQVVVQPPQDSAAILALTAKLDGLQKKLADDQAKAEKAAAEAAARAEQAAIEAAKPKEPTPAELEIKKLKALLAAEKEKNSLERERQRQEELEAYRRKHYPELYAPKKAAPVRRKAPPSPVAAEEEPDDDLDELIKDITAKTYFDEDADEEKARPAKPASNAKQLPSPSPSEKTAESEEEKEYSIPVDVKGSSIRWSIPEA